MAENALTEKYMQKALSYYPVRQQLEANAYYSFGTLYRSGKYYFEFHRTEFSSAASLYLKKKSTSDSPELVIAPEDYKVKKGDIKSIRDFEVSKDNKLIAFTLSTNGSDWMEIRVKKISPLKDLNDVITGVKFSAVKWKDNGFFYCRYESMQKDKPLTSLLINPCLYYHKLGTPQESDSLIFEYAGDKISGTISFDVLENERFLIVYHGASAKVNRCV
jgi:prolyl oligopeptidase